MSDKIIFISTHPIQYIVPLYQAIEDDGVLSYEVVYFTDETIKGGIDKHFGREIKWDIPLLEGYKYIFLKNYSWKPSLNTGFWGLLNFGIIPFLWKQPKKSILIVSGWSNASFILTIVFGKLFGHIVSLRTEAPIAKEINRKGILSKLRKVILQVVFKILIDYGFYIGSQNKAFYEFYGLKSNKLFFTPYCVDNDRFNSSYLSQIERKKEIRKELGFPEDDFIVLFTGKFYDVKRPLDLIKAFELANIENKSLVMVGDGILKSNMEQYILDSKIDKVILPGFINQSEISKYYITSDVLVLCSESETWGLSINEAMNFQLPIILNESIGCHSDLLKDGVNGILVRKGDIYDLSNAITKIGNDKVFRKSAGIESNNIIKKYSFDTIIEGIKSSLNA